MDNQTSVRPKKPANGIGTLILGITAFAAICALALGVLWYQHSRKPAANSPGNFGTYPSSGPGGTMSGPGDLNGPGGGSQVGGGIGTVTAISSTSISIKDSRTGSDTAYTITSSTTITNSGATASTADIKVGDTVAVQTDSSSSTTAVQIMLNPHPGMINPGSSPS